jgi:GT2 family glycosyltransferase
MDGITVVIPTADRPEMLERSVTSALAQSWAPAHIIVVDNGVKATDYRSDDPRVRIIRTEPRIGAGRSRNIGAQSASTTLVSFLDDDDYWLPGYLERVVEAFAGDPSIDAVVGQLYRRRADGMPKPYKLFPPDPESQRELYFRNPGFGGQNLTIKRAVLSSLGGFDESLPASVDRDLGARLLRRGARIAVAPEAIAVLCDHGATRVRMNQVRGNRRFIEKHWMDMRWNERAQAIKTLIKRWIRSQFGRRGLS